MIKIEPQDTFLAFWVISFPAEAKMDMMGAIWRHGDTGEYLGRYRYRYYDPLDPGNHALSGKDRKEWFEIKFEKRPDITEIKEAVTALAKRSGGKLHWTNKKRSGDEMAAYLKTLPWTYHESKHDQVQ